MNAESLRTRAAPSSQGLMRRSRRMAGKRARSATTGGTTARIATHEALFHQPNRPAKTDDALSHHCQAASVTSRVRTWSGTFDELQMFCVQEGGGVSEWQPISTAPKDDQRILLCNAKCHPEDFDGQIAVGLWTDRHGGQAANDEYIWADWNRGLTNGDVWMPVEFIPTHWMPLPDPPASNTGE